MMPPTDSGRISPTIPRCCRPPFRDDLAPGSGASAGRLRSAPSVFRRRDRMPAERTPMRHVREVLRLKFVGGVPTREIARRIGVAASTVRATIKRFQAAGLSWPVAEDMTEAALEARLFSDAG